MRKLLLVALFVTLASSARAETGDYDALNSLLNWLFVYGADNPVTPEQMLGPYPLIDNPEEFADGYVPNAWGQWQTIQLHPDTGAVCGNGSPYKFFINRVPTTTNTVVYMEGGGACWDYESCTGDSALGARNPNGIPDNYLDLSNPATVLVSPFVFRAHPYSTTKVQQWNLVYIPYCTGDVYTGDKIAVYESESGEDSVVWHHNGLRNVRAVVAWLKNNLPKPGQALMTGCSAGGGGSLANYAHLRSDLDPEYGFMINDSGPIYPAPDGADPGTNPSVLMHNQFRSAWGIDEGPGPRLAELAPGFMVSDLGTLSPALASRFPGDRFGHTHFRSDLNFSRYSYEEFYDEIANAPSEELRNELLLSRWDIDTRNLTAQLDPIDNYGYFIPNFRALNTSHCATIVDFENADIQELGLELGDFINNVLDGEGRVIEGFETDTQSDYLKPLNWLYFLIDNFL